MMTNGAVDDSQVIAQIISTLMVHRGYISKLRLKPFQNLISP